MSKVFSTLKIVIIICVVFLLSGCINDEDNNDNKNNEETIYYSYILTIQPSHNSNFILYLPCIVHGNWIDMKNQHELDGELITSNNVFEIIEGEGEVSIISTPYGYALNISGSNFIKIQITRNNLSEINTDGGNPNIRLSLINDSDNDGRKDDEYGNVQHWLFCNSSDENCDIDISLIFDIHYSKDSFSGTIEISGLLQNGWQLVNGTKEAAAD